MHLVLTCATGRPGLRGLLRRPGRSGDWTNTKRLWNLTRTAAAPGGLALRLAAAVAAKTRTPPAHLTGRRYPNGGRPIPQWPRQRPAIDNWAEGPLLFSVTSSHGREYEDVPGCGGDHEGIGRGSAHHRPPSRIAKSSRQQLPYGVGRAGSYRARAAEKLRAGIAVADATRGCRADFSNGLRFRNEPGTQTWPPSRSRPRHHLCSADHSRRSR